MSWTLLSVEVDGSWIAWVICCATDAIWSLVCWSGDCAGDGAPGATPGGITVGVGVGEASSA